MRLIQCANRVYSHEIIYVEKYLQLVHGVP